MKMFQCLWIKSFAPRLSLQTFKPWNISHYLPKQFCCGIPLDKFLSALEKVLQILYSYSTLSLHYKSFPTNVNAPKLVTRRSMPSQPPEAIYICSYALHLMGSSTVHLLQCLSLWTCSRHGFACNFACVQHSPWPKLPVHTGTCTSFFCGFFFCLQ